MIRSAFNEGAKTESIFSSLDLEQVMIKKMSDPESIDIDIESYEEIKSLAEEIDLND